MKLFVKKLIENLFTFLFIFFRLFKIEKNKIILSSLNGKGYGENPKYICENIINKKYPYKLYWSVKKLDYSMPKEIEQIKIYSLRWFYHMATAKMWINDSRFPSFVRKRKGQYYLQTWHSSLRLKKIEKDVADKLPTSYICDAKNDSRMIDLIICGSEFSKNTFSNSFWYNGEISMIGTPKFDIYFCDNKETIKKAIYKKYNIESDKKIVLYAPTFRSSKKNFSGSIDFNIFLNDSRFKDYIFLVRLHPEATNKNLTDNIINVTDYPNFQDLLISSELLITDYSGCCFDALIEKKPCILYVPDLDEYIAKERDLYFDFDSLPFVVLENIEDLKNNILKFDYDNYLKNINLFNSKVKLNEFGNATDKVVDKINEVLRNGKKI